MIAMIRRCMHLIFILMAVGGSLFLVSLVSVFVLGLLIVLSLCFFLLRQYSQIIETIK